MKHPMATAASLALVLAPLASGTLATGTAGAAAPHVVKTMRLETGHMDGKPGWPKITNSSWTVKKGESVTVRIISFDDGTAPLVGNYMKYDRVMGTTTGTELVAGKAVKNVSDINIAHTFTLPTLGFNMPIPVAPTGKSIVVTATFVPKKVGTFVWHCFAPCGSGANGMGGAMSTMTWMTGKIRVVA
ncbi:MAG: hypothetical protein ACP5OV_06840 [Acidimicrobiales bacterium]